MNVSVVFMVVAAVDLGATRCGTLLNGVVEADVAAILCLLFAVDALIGGGGGGTGIEGDNIFAANDENVDTRPPGDLFKDAPAG